METYFVRGNENEYFVKIGAPVERYRVMAEIGLSPVILSFGQLESGLSILVQPLLQGRNPSRLDFQNQLDMTAALIYKMHHDPRIRDMLQPACTNLYKEMGLQGLNRIVQRWECYKTFVPDAAEFVDKGLEGLARQIRQFSGEGLTASHNDICNANWVFTADGQIFILDLDSMSMEDPALDLGALLWWYYPPVLRSRFLKIAGFTDDDEFKTRMRARMALHCLNVALPREQSFDVFQPDHFYGFLTDFKAVLNGEENPQGYAT